MYARMVRQAHHERFFSICPARPEPVEGFERIKKIAFLNSLRTVMKQVQDDHL